MRRKPGDGKRDNKKEEKTIKTAQGLADYALAQLGRPYWWGCFGQTASESLYKQKKAQYPGHYTAGDFSAQYGQRVHDCVGLIKGYRWSDTPDSVPEYIGAQDVAVEGLYAQCAERGVITTIPHTPGVCVFMAGMGHVGVYLGNGEVVEAMNHANGVVKTRLAGRGWAYWGMPDWIDYRTENGTAEASAPASGGEKGPSETGGAAEKGFSVGLRLLRQGCTGGDVRSLQRLLLGRGFSVGPDGADGDFGPNTRAALIRFQNSAGLAPDGEFGPLSFAALWGAAD